MSLQKIREEIDAVDQQLLELLKRRDDLAISVIKEKMRTATEVVDAGREKELLEVLHESCEELGLDADFAHSVWRLILTHSAELQNNYLNDQ